jgi:hypothetical protein
VKEPAKKRATKKRTAKKGAKPPSAPPSSPPPPSVLAPPEPDEDGLTRELLEDIAADIADNDMPRKYAASGNGVSPRTLERWIAMGATGSGGSLRRELARRVFQAEAGKVGGVMHNLRMLASEDGKAGEAFLRLYKPGDFGGPRPEPDEFDALERHAERRKNLWEKPPPKMLREAREHGWWQFSTRLSDEDRATLEAVQAKYLMGPALDLPAAPSSPPEKAS